MKKIFFILCIFLMYITFVEDVHAESYLIKIMNYDLNLRKSSTTSSAVITTLNANTIHELVSREKENDFYKIKTADGKIGYVSSNYTLPFIDLKSELTETTKSCLAQLKDSGFPDSYLGYLCYINIDHPNWVFKPIDVNLDWKYVVEQQSSCGKSYIATSKEEYRDSSCKNPYNKTWYPASNKALAYYLDPRNFLSENFLFQFENLLYDELVESKYNELVLNTIDHAEFYKYHLNLNNDLPTIISNAGKKENINPVFMASRILQEMGANNSLFNLYSGKYPGYEDIYNFINFKVSDSCATTYGPTTCGLKNGWKGLIEAVEGAAKFLGSDYIHKGQYTTYFQKYNVVPQSSNKLFMHQYMTNIEAPYSEGKSIYKSYKESNLLSNSYSFSIPVYKNMNELIENNNSGVTDPGEEENELTTLPIATVLSSNGYVASKNYISNFKVGESIEDIVSKIESIAGTNSVIVYDSNKNEIQTGIIRTGLIINIKTAKETKDFNVVLYGDTSGDGKIDALDLLQIQKNILGLFDMSNEYNMAADTSKDFAVNALDLLQVQKNILKLYEIIQ